MIYHVYANRSNIGDWVSARGIQSLLGSQDISELFCDRPFVPETIAALSETTSDDVIVVGGGGLFMDYFVPFWEELLRAAPAASLCLWGVGYCDLKREPTRPRLDLIRTVVQSARVCAIRDTMTRDHLSECALPPPVACPSLAVLKPPAAPGFGILHVDNFTTAGADVFEAMDTYGRTFASSTGRPYRRTNNRIERCDEVSLQAELAKYAVSDLVVSSALHGCIIGLAMGRKVVAVSGDRKIEGFMDAAGLEDWVLDQTEVHELPRRLEKLGEQPFRWEFLQRQVESNREVADAVLALAGAGPGDWLDGT